jgi:hypothetical protein
MVGVGDGVLVGLGVLVGRCEVALGDRVGPGVAVGGGGGGVASAGVGGGVQVGGRVLGKTAVASAGLLGVARVNKAARVGKGAACSAQASSATLNNRRNPVKIYPRLPIGEIIPSPCYSANDVARRRVNVTIQRAGVLVYLLVRCKSEFI